ncbi:hypothetical protein PP459_gp089 [Streptomyces phage Wakanda]|uniref:Uncharacterized protein n=1 Tax=Streptomyces phage Wakanda TaxID=2713267 RepID=A0A6G8R1T4_9CAUD|nr:hypothetical protein PP459_gp089 [Streptomyces phage Wakanda]QIN94144.1 hypothetical protein SEA_WAKANDA_183 [Streptomyces phage Wakanda]
MTRRIIRVVCWVIGMVGFGLMNGNLLDQSYLAFIGGVVIAGVVYISYAPAENPCKEVQSRGPANYGSSGGRQLNREARRHPEGRTPAQKFRRVNAGKQKQGNNKAVKGW